MHYEITCDMEFCTNSKPMGALYCPRHSTPNWETYRHWKKRLVEAIVFLTAVPALLGAAGLAWRFAVWAWVE